LAARVNELLEKLEKELEAHAKTKNRFEKVEIAQKIVDDSHETFLKQHNPPSTKNKSYKTCPGPINANCVTLPKSMTHHYDEADLVYGESSQASMFDSEKRTGTKSVVHVETDEEKIKLGAPAKIVSFDNFHATTSNNSCRHMIVYQMPNTNFAKHTLPLSDEATRMTSTPNAQEEFLKQNFKINRDVEKTESNGKKGKNSGKKVPTAKSSTQNGKVLKKASGQ
jgi:hypothetical protein